jgi:FADH2 O2-dependent halogenase
LPEDAFPDFPRTQAIHTHFSNVALFGGNSAQDVPPYPPDDAALHHVFHGGWIWVLRFNNGLTSAGAAVTNALADRLRLGDGGAAWDRLLDLLPSVREHFAGARAELPFVHAQRLSFLAGTIAGQRWAMLPSAAGFVDPLLSTGFPLTLLGIARLGEIIAQDWDSPRFAQHIDAYAVQTRKEVLASARVIGALYATMSNFPLFMSISFLYFAAASFAETARRLDKPQLAPSFLLCDHPIFGPACERLCRQALQVRTETESADLRVAILHTIEPFNVAGLGKAQCRNWFPADARDLLEGAEKLCASEGEIRSLLQRCGFRVAY